MGASAACELGGKRLSVGPYRAVFEKFLLPDRDRALEGINHPAAGVEGRGPVRGKYRNQDAAFADFDPPQPVNDGDIAHRKFLPRFRSQILKLAERHAFVGFVLEVKRPAVAA